jgi:hypothetical protein
MPNATLTVKQSTTLKAFFAGHLILTLCLIALVALGWRAYRQERADLVNVEATVNTQQAVVNQQAQSLKQTEQRITDRNAALTKALSSLEKLKAAAPATPVETAAQIAQYLKLPSAPEAPPALSAATQPANSAGAALNLAPAQPFGRAEAAPRPYLTFTPAQAEDLRKAALGCAEDSARLTACQQDQADAATKEQAYRAQLKALTTERDTAIKAVKGGSFFMRLKREAKDVGIGVAVGVAIGYAAHR